LAADLRRITVQVRGSRASGGSGVIWRSDGTIITNAHVAPGREAVVELADGREFDARVTAHAAHRDLASLRIEATRLPAASVGSSRDLRVGQLVFAVGNPLGIAGALTAGIVHAVGPAHRRARQDWVQAAITLMPGNSGGPLADARGAVVGINSMISGPLAFAVPSAEVERFIAGSLNGERPRLGVSYVPVFARTGRSGQYGLLVLEVLAGSPADRAGIALGDVITSIGDLQTTDPEELAAALESAPSDASVPVALVRGGAATTRVVVLEPVGPPKNQAA